MRRMVLAGVLIVIGIAAAYFYLRTTTWYPVARVATPEGYTLTVVMAPVANRKRCEIVNRAFIDPVIKGCPACRLELERCDGSLSGAEKALVSNDALSDYSVNAAGIRMLVTGPAGIAKGACEQIATDMVRAGAQTAACAYPGAKR